MNTNDLINFFQRGLKPLRDRVYILIGRAILTALNDSPSIQEAQLKALADESLEKVQRFQEFGFNSIPPSGTEAVILSIGGSRANTVIVATEKRGTRPQSWGIGEAGLYNVEGMIARLKLGGKFQVNNGEEDFVTVLSDLCQWLIDARVLTAFGYQPLLKQDDLTALLNIKARLDTFKP